MNNQSWMYCCVMDGCLRLEYIPSVKRFISFAFSIYKKNIRGKIRYLYVRCKNQKFVKDDDIFKNLLTERFFTLL